MSTRCTVCDRYFSQRACPRCFPRLPTPNLRQPGAADAFPNERDAKLMLLERGIDVEASYALWMFEIKKT